MAKQCIEAGRRALGVGTLVFMLLSLPLGAAGAAEVVDLRVGVHTDYTRVVFELDQPAAYKIKRGGGQSELVVTLDAGSAVRDVQASKALVGQVTLVPTAKGSKARIKLLGENLKLKEMILANPPRIVLDISGPKPKGAAAPAAAKPVAKAPAPAPKKIAAKPKPKAPVKAPAPVAKAKPKPKAKSKSKSKPAKIIAVSPKPAKPIIKVEAPRKPAPAAPAPQKQASKAPSSAPKRAEPKPLAKAPAVTPPRPLAVEPPAVRPEAEAESSAGSLKQVFALIGLFGLLVVWVMIRRRRGRVPLPSKSRLSTLSEKEGGDAANPFAALDSSEETPEVSDTTASLAQTTLDESPFEESGDDWDQEEESAPASSSGLSAGEFLRREAESAVRDSPALGSEAPEPASEPVAVDPYEAGRSAGREVADEALALVRGLEDKIASLQERLGDAVDSRERIERQIAAQNEELRVQRAAIARTQRAVRNISRPDDDEDRSDAGGPAVD